MNSYIQESFGIPLIDGAEIIGTLAYAVHPGPKALLCVHGFGGHRHGEKWQAVRQACARRGWTYAAFDFRGHGDSSGTLIDLRARTLIEDLQAIEGYLHSRGIAELGIVASSMGAFASAWYTVNAARFVRACVFLAPAFHFLEARWTRLTDVERQRWQQTGIHHFRNEWLEADLSYELVEEIPVFPIVELTANWRTPTLIVHGMQDTVVPWEESLQFMQQASGSALELRLKKTGDHRLTAFKEELAETCCDFFAAVAP